MGTTLEQRRIIRKAAGANVSCPVEVVPGDDPPQVVGDSYRWETMGGRPIYHPSAYSRQGWSNMRYVSSDRRVQVGEGWVWEHCPLPVSVV